MRKSGVSAVLDTITHSQALFFLSMLCHYYCYRVNKAFDVHFAQFYLSFVFVALDFLALSLSVSLNVRYLLIAIRVVFSLGASSHFVAFLLHLCAI